MPMLHRLIVIALLCAALFSFFDVENTLELRASLNQPIAANGQEVRTSKLSLPLLAPTVLSSARATSLDLQISSAGYSSFAVLELDGKGAGLTLVEDRGQPGERRRSCVFGSSTIEAGLGRCRISFRVTGGQTHFFVLVSTSGDVTIDGLRTEVVTAKREVSASGNALYLAFFLLLFLGPIFAYLKHYPRLESLLYLAISTTWLAIAGWSSVVIVFAFIAATYAALRWVVASSERTFQRFVATVFGSIVLLLFLKFAAPYVASAFANPGGFALALPLGLSYIAIRFIDLLLSAYGGHVKSITLLDYATFMLFPHTFAAGPIFTHDQFVDSRIENYNVVDFSSGAARMGLGVAKKVAADALLLPLIGKSMQSFAESGGEPSPTVVVMLLANVAYVYLDFSAYCDLAIGAGRASGRRVPENFDWPLLRNGIRQYWQHWHMTLSNWVMRRIYFPAFLSSRSQTASLVASMLMIGLWHVPNLSWASWAVHHALAMRAESVVWPGGWQKAPQPTFTGWMRYGVGVVFVWLWVALGHSFTLFSNYTFALRAYFGAIASPFSLY